MSGESTARRTSGPDALERAFGASAACNRCGERTADYRVIARFMHDTVAVRGYCPGCYAVAVEGEYHARGDGWISGYEDFGRRFGAPGPPPPPATPVDQLLAMLVRDASVVFLAPPSEAVARRAGASPYRFRLTISTSGEDQSATFGLHHDGRLEDLRGEPAACERVTVVARSA